MTAPTAAALNLPPAVDQNMQQVTGLVRDGSPRVPASNAYLRAKERLAANTPGGARLHQELNALRASRGLYPKLTTFARWGVTALAAGIGWKIGTSLNAKVLRLGLADPTLIPGSGDYYAYTWVPAGSVSQGNVVPGPAWVVSWSDDFENGPWWEYTYENYVPKGDENEPCPQYVPFGSWIPPLGGEKVYGPLIACTQGQAQNIRVAEKVPGADEVHTPVAITGALEDWDGSEQLDITTTHADGQVPVPPSVADMTPGVRTELETGKYPLLVEWLDYQLGGDGSDPTLPVMPNCTGLSYNACVVVVQAAGFGVITRETRSFSDAVPLPQGQPDEVFGTTPQAGVTAPADTEVLIDANPADEDLPRIVPAPGARELPAQYETRALAPIGLTLGSPLVLSDEQTDPLRGPDEVVTTDPAPGARVAPDVEIVPRVNPSTAPEPVSGDNWTPPPVRSPDLSPLADIQIGCTTFPFGIFCWLHQTLGGWGTSAGCPDFTVPFVHGDLEIDFCTFEPAMSIVRPVIALVALLCGAYLFSAAAMGFGAATNDD